MNDWLNANVGVIVAVFGSIISLAALLLAVKSRASDETLRAKDATIELLRAELSGLRTQISEVEGYKRRVSDEREENYQTLIKLHQRISELESKQFFERDEEGDIVIKDS